MYVPRHGDIVWIDFNPQVGHEQAKERPALVLSEELYNRRLWLAIMCPITTSRKSYRVDLDVSIPAGVEIRNTDNTSVFELTGVIQADHIKSLDWWARGARYAGDMPDATVIQVLQILGKLVKIW